MASLPGGAREVVAVPGVIWFRLVSNSGATFSLGRNHNLLFAAGTAAVLVAIAVIVGRGVLLGRVSNAALGVIAGGALGNLTDRIRLGSVVDFIQIRFWPTDFNLADAAIRAGVLAILLALLLEQRRRPRARA